MPRPKAINPTKEFKFYASLENAAEIEIRCYEPSSGRNRFGAVSALINEALASYFKSQKETPCPQFKSKPDSPNSEQSDKPAS